RPRAFSDQNSVRCEATDGVKSSDANSRHGINCQVDIAVDVAAVFLQRQNGVGNPFGIRFRVSLWIESSWRLPAGQPPPLWFLVIAAGQKIEIRSQIGSNEAAFLRWLGQNR